MDDLPKITVTRPEYLPVPDRECKTVCVANMTREERDVYRQGITCPLIKKQLEGCEESQFYQHCKRDRCKEMQDCKEKEKEEKIQKLTERNQTLEKDLDEYKKLTEERFNKLTKLLLEKK
tara:strand:- start:4428 stop:4787 length:360 start_codon:yes stop_codon:yes gene_type:complete